MSIRPFRPDDAPDLAALWNGYIRDTDITFTTVEKTCDDIAALAGRMLLVLDLDGPAGLATYGTFRAGPGYAHTAELTLLLAPRATGGGHGPALLRALEDAARAEGLHALVAGVSGANPGAARFFLREGYAQAGLMPQVGRKAGRWLDLILLQRIL